MCSLSNAQTAVQIDERIRGLVQKYDFIWQRRSSSLTVCIGVAILSSTGKDSQALIEAADAALYQAKNGGRNRITVAG